MAVRCFFSLHLLLGDDPLRRHNLQSLVIDLQTQKRKYVKESVL